MTSENPVHVRIQVMQIEDGRVYSGSLRLDDVFFNYAIDFSRSLGELARTGVDFERLSRDVSLTVIRQGKPVEVDEDVMALFMATAGRSIIDFYFDHHTREAQEGFTGRMLRNGLFGGELYAVDTENTYGVTARTAKLNRFIEKYRKIR